MVAAMFARSGVDLAFAVSFIVLMVAAATLDVECRRIPNALVLAILLIGVLFALYGRTRDGTLRVLEGAGMGLGVWIPFWALGMIGAGDVKFFAAASAWLGPRLALDAALHVGARGRSARRLVADLAGVLEDCGPATARPRRNRTCRPN